MTDPTPPKLPIERIAVRVKVGEHILSATDDPLFLGLRGPAGREFRLVLKHGKSLRRGSEDHYVLAPPDGSLANVAHPELNDPTTPPLGAEDVESVFLRKGLDPIPNVRGVAEMDDRLELIEAEVELYVRGREEPVRFLRRGPIWLGLISGLQFEIPRLEGA